MDEFDRRILQRLQLDARTTSEEIAESVGLSATAVQRRIKRLRSEGAIRAEVAIVDPAAVGQGLTVIVGIELIQGSRTDLIDRFKRRMAAEPQVQQCYYVAGDHDFVLVVLARDVRDYEALSRRLWFEDANIKRFSTTFVLDPVKTGLQVPIA
ncbi:asnC family protein [Lysobacter antibioticus]|uniref:Lrp/AsnC family transcriptional regulator n=1 Tax=Lysobacter antibioticus TaxID=84531 RepID=UPI0007171B5E|nr:Lrp/AsnC family transcriptional regulator [Lysobacter antibioticus]ALN63388.1 asnC family protein [Lysobacter antibioticus]